MRISAHCFAFSARTDKSTILFKFKDFDVSLITQKHNVDKDDKSDDYDLMLEVSKSVDPSELKSPPKEERDQDKEGRFIESRMRPYKIALTEASQLIEGLIAINYPGSPPKFDPDRIIVNVTPENHEEEARVKSGELSGGFGNIYSPPSRPSYGWNDKIIGNVEEAANHLPGLSFLAQGCRSLDQNDHEVAFFLFFRIIEGYFSDGSRDLESALLKNSEELKKFLKYDAQSIEAAQNVLVGLGLKSKSATDFDGFISDLVLIRHKLTHFNATNQERHHRAAIKYDLRVLNHFLRISCTLVLRKRIGID